MNSTNFTFSRCVQPYHAANPTEMTHFTGRNQANELGFGVGRLIGMVTEQIGRSWQNFWRSEPSQEECALRMQRACYLTGLENFVRQLEKNCSNIRMNPNDPSALKKIKMLAAEHPQFAKLHERDDFRSYQEKQFRVFKNRISALKSSTIDKLRPLLPAVFQKIKKTEFSIQESKLDPAQNQPPKQEGTQRTSIKREESLSKEHISSKETHQDLLTFDLSQMTDAMTRGFIALDEQITRLFPTIPGAYAEKTDAVSPYQQADQHSTKDVNVYNVYITDVFNNDIVVLSTFDNIVQERISGAGGYRGITISPDDKYAYAVCCGNAVFSVNLLNRTTDRIFLADGIIIDPLNIEITPDGKHLYVTTKDSVYVIETENKKVVSRIDNVGQQSVYNKAISITPDGFNVYVPDSNNADNVKAISTITNSVVATIPMLMPGGIAITKDGSKVYVIDGIRISIISTKNNTVIDTIRTEFSNMNSIAMTHDGQYAYMTGANNNVYVLNLQNNTFISTIPVRDAQEASIAITPDDHYVYVISGKGVLSVISTTNHTVIYTASISPNTYGIAITHKPTTIPPDNNNRYIIIGVAAGSCGFLLISSVVVYFIWKRFIKTENNAQEHEKLIAH